MPQAERRRASKPCFLQPLTEIHQADVTPEAWGASPQPRVGRATPGGDGGARGAVLIRAGLLALGVALAGCDDFPRDATGTLERVRARRAAPGRLERGRALGAGRGRTASRRHRGGPGPRLGDVGRRARRVGARRARRSSSKRCGRTSRPGLAGFTTASPWGGRTGQTQPYLKPIVVGAARDPRAGGLGRGRGALRPAAAGTRGARSAAPERSRPGGPGRPRPAARRLRARAGTGWPAADREDARHRAPA